MLSTLENKFFSPFADKIFFRFFFAQNFFSRFEFFFYFSFDLFLVSSELIL